MEYLRQRFPRRGTGACGFDEKNIKFQDLVTFEMTSKQIEKVLRNGGIRLPPDPDPLSSRSPLDLVPGIPIENDWADITLYNFIIEGSEADVVATNSRTGVIEEYEIKVSRSDLLRECIIAEAAISNNFSKMRNHDIAKYRKHQRFHEKKANYPTYYSFAVPADLVDLALEKAPPYAGIISVRLKGNDSYLALERAREPTCVSHGKGDKTFFAEAAKHLSNEQLSIRLILANIKENEFKSKRELLKNLTNALIEVETELKKQGHWSKDAVEFLVSRAVCRMSQYEKDCVRRYFLSSDFRQLDLFD